MPERYSSGWRTNDGISKLAPLECRRRAEAACPLGRLCAAARSAGGCGAARRAPPVAEAGGHDGDRHLALQALVDHGAEDDVGVVVGRLGDDAGGLVDLVEREVAARR